ncbi:MAG: FtsQ-type POTRA domain-containing protein [Lachnospiraceae bacterium]|nr:FtsQ-type POTRA domain-containing protein [Lachnospiraceae bacterium]
MGKKGKKWIAILFLGMLLVAGILWAGNYLLSKYHVENVYVDGNIHYTNEEIEEMIMGGVLGDNSLYLSRKYKNWTAKGIPFIDAITVETLSPDTIKITVYEKALAGYIKYLDAYMYFDKDGYLVENSSVRTVGIPQITGLSFSYAVLGKPLPVEDDKVFGDILTITKLLKKYELSADRIQFDGNNVTLHFSGIRIALGNERSRLENKIMIIPQVLDSLGDVKGVFHMETYDETHGNYVFKPTE